MRVLIGINNLISVDQTSYANHCQMWYRFGKDNSEKEFMFCNPRRMSIDMMRNFAAKQAMEFDCDYLLFIDDDVLVPVNFNWLERLIKADKDIIAGVTMVRGYPYRPMIFDWELKEDDFHIVDYKSRIGEDGLVKCDAVGFSLCLIKVSILKDLVPPFFVTGINHTEDIYFCHKVKRVKPDVSIYVDPTVETLHRLEPDFIGPENIEARMLYDESTKAALKDNKADRGQEYLEECQKALG